MMSRSWSPSIASRSGGVPPARSTCAALDSTSSITRSWIAARSCSFDSRIQRTFPAAWFADAYGLIETVSADALIEHCRSQLARYKVPKDVLFLDALPRNPSGKVLKRELRSYG